MTNVKNSYETVLVFSMKLGDEGIEKTIEKFQNLISENAEFESVDKWGKRKFAYLINKEAEGYYVLFNFKSDADFPAELDRICKITDGVLRSLIVKKEN